MPDNRVSHSLSVRLNATLFFRQIHLIFWLNIMICVIFAAGLIFYTEYVAYPLMLDNAPVIRQGVARQSGGAAAEAEVGQTLRLPGQPSDGEILYKNANYTILWLEHTPRFALLPEDAREYLPEKIQRLIPGSFIDTGVGRWLRWSMPWYLQVREAYELSYELSIPNGDGWLVSRASIGLPVFVFLRCFIALLVIQLISILFSLGRNSRSVNKTLKPLQELSVSARALTEQRSRLSPESLQSLTGALDSFNVRRLDAGLPLAGVNDELKPLIAAINEMLSRIDEAYREQIRFVSDASHELRTPIAVIKGYAEILSRWGTEDPGTLKESIAAIRHEADAMNDMVEKLLFLARGESDSINLARDPVDLSALGAEVFREVKMIDDTHEFITDAQPLVIVTGDEGMLKQLLRILVDNSVKYTPAGGKITLRVHIRDDRAIASVQDEGGGIPEADIPRVFDRFYRADASRTRGTGGVGLGLSIAKWIAQKHGGSIGVISRENIGTRMEISLPLYAREDAAGA